MDIPSDLRYSSDHEWARVEEGRGRIGITDYAQEALGDVVFVEVPEVGTKVERGPSFREVESTKSVSEIYAPVSGVIAEINADLADSPERLNDDPYGEGWICIIDPADPAPLEELLDAEGYRALIEGGGGWPMASSATSAATATRGAPTSVPRAARPWQLCARIRRR